jgi:predicted ATPase
MNWAQIQTCAQFTFQIKMDYQMITYIKINGFKSFYNFEMEFTPFTVIAGANAAGKSNLFDALMLLSRLAENNNLKKAFREGDQNNQRGDLIECFTKYGEGDYATEMEFVVEMLVHKTIKDAWNEKKLKYTRLRYELKLKRMPNSTGIEDLIVTYEHLEAINSERDEWIKRLPADKIQIWQPKVTNRKKSKPYIYTEIIGGTSLIVVQENTTTHSKKSYPLINATRTVLSSFDTLDFPHILAAKEEMKSWKFLQLNPTDLRQPTNKYHGDSMITPTGKNLAAVLFRIKQNNSYQLKEISRKLALFLPTFMEVDVVNDEENNQYWIKLKDTSHKTFSSRVLSEGTLRILALCILEYDTTHTGLLCFEEPENGIHPFRVKAMIQLLKDLSTDFEEPETPLRQVIVNTHSPILVGNLFQAVTERYVSLEYAQMRTAITDVQITDTEKKRMKINYTKITPVSVSSNPSETEIERERKFTLATVIEYLQTTDFETILNLSGILK